MSVFRQRANYRRSRRRLHSVIQWAFDNPIPVTIFPIKSRRRKLQEFLNSEAFRPRANYRRSRRRLHSTIQWAFDTPQPVATTGLENRQRRAASIRFQTQPRWDYERHRQALRRRSAIGPQSSSLTGAATQGLRFDEVGVEASYKITRAGIEPSYLGSVGVSV